MNIRPSGRYVHHKRGIVMRETNLRTVEKKVLGAMLILADDDMNVKTSMKQLAETMGYKKAGGALTFAIEALEMKNYIATIGKGQYKVLL